LERNTYILVVNIIIKMRFSNYITEQKSRAVGIFIGRMSPPTKAHQKIIEDSLKKYSKVYIFIIEGEKSSKLAKNFLTYNQRKSILKITNPKAHPILSSHGYIPDIIKQENIETSNGVAIIAGSDRIEDYKKQFIGVDYNVIFDEIKRTAEDISASKVRKAIGENDFEEYKRNVARGLDNKEWFEKFREFLRATIGRPGNVRGQIFKEQRIYTIQEVLNEDINRHIEHFEDNMFNNGVNGIEKNIELAKLIRDTLSGGSKSKAAITVKWDGCIHPDTIIKTKNGDMKMKEILGKNDVEVFTYNFDKGIDELNLAIKPRINHNNKNWVEVELENGDKIIVTEDHEFYTINRGWVKAIELNENDNIKETE